MKEYETIGTYKEFLRLRISGFSNKKGGLITLYSEKLSILIYYNLIYNL